MTPSWLSDAFLTIFLFGLIFTLVSLVLGLSHIGGLHLGHGHGAHAHGGGHVHIGGHGHAAHAGPAHGGHSGAAHSHAGSHGSSRVHADFHIGSHKAAHVTDGNEGPGVLNMPTIMAFVTWFGGAGYIFTRTLGVGAVAAVPMAVLSGLTGGAIMFLLLARFLWPAMSQPLKSEDYRRPGTAARVVSTIRSGGVGEIVYKKGGSRFTAGARCETDKFVAKGTEVVILRYERGIAYVEPIDDLLNKPQVER